MPDDAINQEQDGGLDLSAIFSPSTSGDTDTTGGTGAKGGLNQAPGGQSDGYKFGGRSYKTQQEAEQAHNKLYGKYSEQQSMLNQLKGALKNPKLFAELSKDPAYAQILAKLGIQQAEEEMDAEAEEDEREAGEVSVQSLAQQIKMDRAQFSLEREESKFERKLGRDLKSDERDAILAMIGRAPELTYEEAYKLAFHEKLLKEAQARAGANGRGTVNRPPPTPLNIPGVKLDTKKAVGEMSKAEFREHLRQSPEFQGLMQR